MKKFGDGQKRPIDNRQLEQELDRALAADELYALQNDAKLRAIEQAVPTYEHFRQMVNGAHLKPLDRRESVAGKSTVKWNVAATYDPMGAQLPIAANISSVTFDRPLSRPKNIDEFRSIWKELDDETKKFEFLANSRKIFWNDFPSEVLKDCLETCLAALRTPTTDENLVIDILDSLSRCKRFNLAIAFLSNEEKTVRDRLFRELGLRCSDDRIAVLNRLEQCYFQEEQRDCEIHGSVGVRRTLGHFVAEKQAAQN